jgi:hypothetical protein
MYQIRKRQDKLSFLTLDDPLYQTVYNPGKANMFPG